MATRKNRLTHQFCNAAPDGTHADGDGLVLRVGKGGRQKSWGLRVMVDGKAKVRGLGSFPVVSLADARKMATAERAELKAGKQATRHARAPRHASLPPPVSNPSNGLTFRECADKVIALRAPNWSSDRHATQWTESLTLHAYPKIGDLPVSSVTSADVLDLLTPIWNEKAETATRVKQRMGAVFDWAIAAGIRTDNPATAVGRALPRRPRLKQHHPALPYWDVPELILRVRESTTRELTRLALEFVILTAARAGEVRGATWAEIDLDSAVWEIPAERMKMRRGHRVPLSDAAIGLLLAAKYFQIAPDGLVFPGTKGMLSNMAFTMLLRRLGVDATTHGFRSSFKDFALNETSFSWAVSETALAHNLGNSMESAYARTDLFEQRRELMAAWAEYLGLVY